MPTVDPLTRAAQIADNNGFPSQFFIRQWNNLLALPALGTAGGVSTTIDQIGSTQGQILYRSATAWSALSPGTTGQLLRTNGAAANPSWASLSSILDIIGSTRGAVIYRGASAWAILAPGTNGDVLTSNGSGNDPSYTTPSSGGATNLDGLSDVAITAPADGDFLWYDPDAAVWKNGQNPPYTVWDETNMRFDGLYLHRNRRRITNSYNVSADRMAKGTTSRSSGKYYFEILIHATSDTHFPICGVAESGTVETSFVGNAATAWGMGIGGSAWNNNSASSGLSTYAAGDILGVAVDFTASTGSITFYKNNVSNKVYSSLTLNAMFPAGSCRCSQNQQSFTIRTLASQCTYSPPGGYSNWG